MAMLCESRLRTPSCKSLLHRPAPVRGSAAPPPASEGVTARHHLRCCFLGAHASRVGDGAIKAARMSKWSKWIGRSTSQGGMD